MAPSLPSTFNAANSALGNCITDSFSIHTIGSTGTPQICGLNTGQHGKSLENSDIDRDKFWSRKNPENFLDKFFKDLAKHTPAPKLLKLPKLLLHKNENSHSWRFFV